MTPFIKRPDTPHPIAFRLPEIARQQLDELMNRWGENQSQAIIRCIERVWLFEKNQVSIPITRVNPYGDSVFSKEDKKMGPVNKTKLASLLSKDGNIEVALYPAGIEIVASARMKEELEAAIELEKESTWLPIWRQLKGFIMTNVSKIVLNLTKFASVPLEDFETIVIKDGRLEVVSNHETIIKSTTRMYGKVGKYEIDLRPGDEGVFNQTDVLIFAKRVEEVKPLYLNYLKSISSLPTHP
ncbi:MAG: hypothetical protein FJZ98_04780 [Chloroflexi bacterium]|nr:hypothetical protein [Chloroflexota bacterium]